MRRLEPVEQDQAVTADALGDIYAGLLDEYWGPVLAAEPRARNTWARVPHFFQSPYYVYQYATCYASTAKLMGDIRGSSEKARAGGVTRYLDLLRAGGSDHPMKLLQRAGVDLSQPGTVRAVARELDELVTKLEQELGVSS